MLKKLLGVVSAKADDTLRTSGIAPHDGRYRELRLRIDSCHMGPFPFMGVVIALIDCTHQSFTYPNEPLVALGHKGSDKPGSIVHIFAFQSHNSCDSLALALSSKYLCKLMDSCGPAS